MLEKARFPRTLLHIGWRYLVLHRWQSLLMILGVAVGVAVMVSIDLANASAARAFELSTEAVTGKATHQIAAGSNGLDEDIYVQLTRAGLLDTAAPIVTSIVASPQLGGQPIQLLGVDPFVETPFRDYLGGGGSSNNGEYLSLLIQPGAIMISRETANRYGLIPGDELILEIDGFEKQAHIVGLVQSEDRLTNRALNGIILADIASAQELTGTVGRLSRIDLILPKESEALQGQIQAALPAGVQLTTVEARQGSIEQMASAFQLNLIALSMLALVVGLFLIYNTMTFAVVQRRTLFGRLRCLGVTPQEIFILVLSEAAVVGLVGSALGVVLGILMGQNTVGMVSRTINDLYFTTTVRDTSMPLGSLFKGGLVGLAATVFTTVLPAWEAASVPPQAALSRSGLESKARNQVVVVAFAGLGLIVAGVVMFLIPSTSLILGFGGTLAVVVGFAMLSALLMVFLMRLVTPILHRIFGLLGQMAPRNVVNALSRTSVAVAALMVAVAVMVGMGVMISSFRNTVTIWLGQTLQGDIYISAPSFTANTPRVEIAPEVVQAVLAWPDLESVSQLRSVQVLARQGLVDVTAVDNPAIEQERIFKSREGKPGSLWDRMQAGEVIISEPLANRLSLDAGDEIELQSPLGWQTYRVIGVYFDYASSSGTLMMAMDIYRQAWQENGVTSIGINLPDGVDVEDVTRRLQDGLGTYQRLTIRPNQALRDDVMVVFDRTFAITSALRILATIVAFIGVLSALLLLQLEKQREMGILRALGLTGRQLWRLVMLETGLMGLAAGLLALPAGYALSLILVHVINQRSFGWTIQMAAQPETFLQALGVALAAALLAGIYPAWRMSRTTAAEEMRYE